MPKACLPCASLYFTGSDHLNKQMRLKAMELGYKLSEYSLCKLVDGKEGDVVPVDSEEAVFRLLGMDYLPPTERNVEG